jgi:hypothetical protein
MTEVLYLYAVPTAQLLAVPGSRDRALLARIRREYRLVADVDRMIEESNELAEEAEDETRIEIGFLEAVRRVVFGEPLLGADESFVYGFAYDAICQVLGRELPGSILPFEPKDLDAALAKLGIPLRMTELCFGGPLFPLPRPGEFPSIGCWSAEQLAAAREPLQRVFLPGLEAVVASLVTEVRGWYPLLEEGDCVVGVMY